MIKRVIKPDPDDKVPDQEYFIMTLIDDNTKGVRPPKPGSMQVKISGAFATLEEANSAAEKLRNKNMQLFNVYVLKMYSFFELPAPKNILNDINKVYSDEKLTKIMQQRLDNQDVSRRKIEERIKNYKSIIHSNLNSNP